MTILTTQPQVENIPADLAAMVSIRSLKKEFRRKNGHVVAAIDDVTLDVHPGEFLVLLGPSGCGKTTLLRTIAGLEMPDSGEIRIAGTPVFDSSTKVMLPPERRDLGMIFQSYALWPHMSVLKNVEYPLKARRGDLTKTQIREKANRILGLLGLSEMAESYPSHLSGGQQQRVALARALVGGRRLILFDEPLSNVDAKVRETLRRELKLMQSELGFSAVYVTHDQTEAMELADRIAVVKSGRVEQVASPQELYDNPASRYVADFIGGANLAEGTVTTVHDDGTVTVETVFGAVEAQGSTYHVGDTVVVLARPERCEVTLENPHAVNSWPVQVGRRVFYGAHVEVEGEVNGVVFRAWIKDGSLPHDTTQAWLRVAPEHVSAIRP